MQLLRESVRQAPNDVTSAVALLLNTSLSIAHIASLGALAFAKTMAGEAARGAQASTPSNRSADAALLRRATHHDCDAIAETQPDPVGAVLSYQMGPRTAE